MFEGARQSPLVVLSVATLAVFTDSLVYSLLIPVMPKYAGADTSSADIGVLLSVFAAAVLVTTRVVGLVVDRVGNRTPMIFGLLALAAATLLFGFARGLPWLSLARALQGMASASTATASLALIASAIPAEQRGKAMGIWMSGSAAGSLLGPPVGGFLYQQFGHWGPLVLAAGLALVDGLGRTLLIAPKQELLAPRAPLRRFLVDPTVLDACAVALVGAVGLTLLEATLPVHVRDRFGASPTTIGGLFAAATLTFGAVSPVAGALKSRLGALKVAVIGLGTLALVLPLVAFASNLPLAFGAVILVGAAVGMTTTPAMPVLADAVDRAGGGAYGAAYSLFNTAFAVGMMVGPLAGSVLVEAFTLKAGLSIISVVTMVVAAVLWRRAVLRAVAGGSAATEGATQSGPG